MTGTSEPILVVDDLKSYFHLRSGILKAVDGLSFSLKPGRVLAIVGESGSGKSVTALSLLRLLDPPGRIEGGRILYRGRNLMDMSEAEMEREIRGNRIAMIFQDPMTSLNPAFTVGEQIAEGIIAHRDTKPSTARDLAVELLRLVGIANPKARYNDYPHQFSGGMRQRVLIATAIACEPDVLIADEPTTALDVTIQAQILKLLNDIQHRLGNAMLLITHDLGVVASMADEVMVMYAGHMVEFGDVETVFREPRHPYTQALFQSLIELEDDRNKPLRPISGSPAIPVDLPPGCPFRPRCPQAFAPCESQYPWPRDVGPSHPVACHLVTPLATAVDVG